jgi:acetylornithine/succinyldiaminopimelate/putrescine aminotransferase
MPTFLDFGLAQTSPYPFGIEVERAEGSYIFDKEGKAYLDFISGIAVSQLGHSHPRILNAIKNQLDKHLHVMVYGEFFQKPQQELAALLPTIFPSSLNTYYFVNSGTEANEAAIKLARRTTGRTEIIAFEGAYHGNSLGSLSISSNESRKQPFRPLLPAIRHIKWNAIEALQSITTKTAAVIMETIQGDAGVRIPDLDFMKALRRKCDEQGTLLILDEIQCGLGRCGKWGAFELFGIVPDLLTLGKALGAGMPIGCLAGSRELISAFSENPSLGHITTFGGHPLVCAAAAEGLRLLKEENWLKDVENKGKFLQNQLRHPKIKAIRQIGLMLAVELDNPQQVEQIVMQALKRGLILFWFLSTPHAFRIAPPLNISEAEMQEGCRILLKLLDGIKA